VCFFGRLILSKSIFFHFPTWTIPQIQEVRRGNADLFRGVRSSFRCWQAVTWRLNLFRNVRFFGTGHFRTVESRTPPVLSQQLHPIFRHIWGKKIVEKIQEPSTGFGFCSPAKPWSVPSSGQLSRTIPKRAFGFLQRWNFHGRRSGILNMPRWYCRLQVVAVWAGKKQSRTVWVSKKVFADGRSRKRVFWKFPPAKPMCNRPKTMSG
jgi:hypothetical protein